MNMKEHILTALREQFNRWEEVLASLSEEQITAPRYDYDWSIKDVMVHVWAWQQIRRTWDRFLGGPGTGSSGDLGMTDDGKMVF